MKKQDIEDIRRALTEGCFPLRGCESEGTIDLNDSDPVYIAVAVEVYGYGPHPGVMYVDQNRYHASADSALQGACEILEDHRRDANRDEFNEDFRDCAAEALGCRASALESLSFEQIETMLDDAGVDKDAVYTDADERFRGCVNGFVYGPFEPRVAAELLRGTEWLQHGVEIREREESDDE